MTGGPAGPRRPVTSVALAADVATRCCRTDGRATAADCHLGGDYTTGTAANADVEMLVHVSADRTNAALDEGPAAPSRRCSS